MDALKSKARVAKEARLGELQKEVAVLEGAFVQACDDAINDMHVFIQYTEATHCIEALAQAQLLYHRKATEVLLSMTAKP